MSLCSALGHISCFEICYAGNAAVWVEIQTADIGTGRLPGKGCKYNELS